jgi:plasmid maintenance system killer protein
LKSVTTSRFRKLRENLPKEIQIRTKEAYELWKNDVSHPSLHFKKLKNSLPIYSVRITLDYRAIGRMENDTIIWFWIGNHSDYNQLISSLK